MLAPVDASTSAPMRREHVEEAGAGRARGRRSRPPCRCPGRCTAATTQNAAWDGSPGTSSSKGCSGDGRSADDAAGRRRRCRRRSAASISSVWARVGTSLAHDRLALGAETGQQHADFTWALATGTA